MSKYYSNTIRIISIITLIAFISTQTAAGYEGRPASDQAQKSLLRSQQAATKGNSVGDDLANSIGVPKGKQHFEESSNENSDGIDTMNPSKKSAIKFLSAWAPRINTFIVKHGKAILFLISLICLQFVRPINANNPLVKQAHSQNVETNMIYGWTVVFMMPLMWQLLSFMFSVIRGVDSRNEKISSFWMTVMFTNIIGVLSQMFAFYRILGGFGKGVILSSNSYWDHILKGSLVNVGDPMVMGYLILIVPMFVSWVFNVEKKISYLFYKYSYLVFLITPIPYIITELFFSSNSLIAKSQNLSPTDLWDLAAYVLGGVLGAFISAQPLIVEAISKTISKIRANRNKDGYADKAEPVPQPKPNLSLTDDEAPADGDAAGVANMAGINNAGIAGRLAAERTQRNLFRMLAMVDVFERLRANQMAAITALLAAKKQNLNRYAIVINAENGVVAGLHKLGFKIIPAGCIAEAEEVKKKLPADSFIVVINQNTLEILFDRTSMNFPPVILDANFVNLLQSV